MAYTTGWAGNATSTVNYDPFTPTKADFLSYEQPPAPPIYNRPGNPGRGGRGRPHGMGRKMRGRKHWGSSPPAEVVQAEEKGPTNEIGYETDWKYPNWLIRMAQWRNF